jgi:hypothetical protein
MAFLYGSGSRDMTYTVSDIDNHRYMVRNRKDKKTAANFLAKLRSNIYLITNYVYNNLNNSVIGKTPRYIQFKPYILQLHTKIKNVVVKESAENTVYTSYTVNKGEQIIFCIRSKNISNLVAENNIHDFNLVMYVMLHEISHVACPEYDHTPLFKMIFKFLCEEAVELGIYKKIDFRQEPKEYCGMRIDDSII